MFEPIRRSGVLRVHHPGMRWLSTGWRGGFSAADAAYLISVPDGWGRVDLDFYIPERLTKAGFPDDGPALLTAVDVSRARGARLDTVVAYATGGLTNPAVLPMDPAGKSEAGSTSDDYEHGTVNLVVGTTRHLDDGALASLLATCVEAKAATLLGTAGVPGTTTDAVVVGCDPGGEPTSFAGSATPVGAAARACVREAVTAALAATYPNELPTPDEAEYGVRTDARAEVFRH